MKPQHLQSYRDVLAQKFREATANNAAYSLRAMARDLKIAPSLLSDILKGKRGLSAERAYDVGKRLKLSQNEIKRFVLLVEIDAAKAPEQKQRLKAELDSLPESTRVHSVETDLFKVLGDWYYAAILELSVTTSLDLTPDLISKELGLPLALADEALKRLNETGFLEPDETGKLKKKHLRLKMSSLEANSAIRRFHTQTLNLAQQALATQTNKEKFVGSETFAFDSESLPAAVQVIEDCFTKLISLSSLSEQNDLPVYHVGIQMFRLSQRRDP